MYKLNNKVLHVETQGKYQITGLPENFVMTGSRLPCYVYKKLDDTLDLQFVRSKVEMEDGRFELIEDVVIDSLITEVIQLIKNFMLGMAIAEKEVTVDTAVSDIITDSLDVVELTMDIEDEFVVEISNDEAEKIKNVKDIIELIKQKRQS